MSIDHLPLGEEARASQTGDVTGKQPRRASSLDPIVLNYDDDSDLYVVLVSEWDKHNRPGPRIAPDGDPLGRPCPKTDNEASGHKGAWQGMCARAHFFAKQSWVAAAFVWRKRDNLLWQVIADGRITKHETDRDDQLAATTPSAESMPLGVLTAGYQGQSQDALFEAAQRENGVVLDIRFNPYSPRPEWTRAALQARFRERYEWLGHALGNANYRTADRHKGVAIVDMARGLERVLSWINEGCVPILLCACKEYETCHRKTVADELLARGMNVRELNWRMESTGETNR